MDLAKLKCFRCQEFGHVGLNCPKNKEKGKGAKGSGKSVQKGKHFENGKSKGKGKPGKSGKGFGKKGKLNEVSWSDEDSWWYDNDWQYSEHDWSWNVDHVGWNDGYYDQDWTWHEGSTWTESGGWADASVSEVNEQTKTDEKQGSTTVGSLTLHAVFQDEACEEEFLHVGSLHLQPFDRLEDACEVETPQPFGRLEDVSPQPFVAGAAGGRQVKSEDWFGSLSGPYDSKLSEPREPSSGHYLASLDRSGAYRHVGDSSLKLSFGGLCLPDVASEGFHEGLVHDSPRRVRVFDFKGQFCNRETTSFEHEFVKVFPTVFPLLSELSLAADSTWWLLDSGAAVTVLSDVHFSLFDSKIEKFVDEGKFRAANGSSVKMRGLATVTLEFQMRNPADGAVSWRTATMQVLVGQTHHNILSTTALTDSGWVFIANGRLVVKFNMKGLDKS